MSTLSDPMMLTLFIASPEEMLGLRAEIMDKSHGLSCLLRRGSSKSKLAYRCVNHGQNFNLHKYFCPGT